MARVSGRLGLCRARPAHSPSHRASLESQLSRPISRYRIDRCKGAIRVTFVDEAIRGVKFERRLTRVDSRAFSFSPRERHLHGKIANNLSELPVRRDAEVAASMRSM